MFHRATALILATAFAATTVITAASSVKANEVEYTCPTDYTLTSENTCTHSVPLQYETTEESYPLQRLYYEEVNPATGLMWSVATWEPVPEGWSTRWVGQRLHAFRTVTTVKPGPEGYTNTGQAWERTIPASASTIEEPVAPPTHEPSEEPVAQPPVVAPVVSQTPRPSTSQIEVAVDPGSSPSSGDSTPSSEGSSGEASAPSVVLPEVMNVQVSLPVTPHNHTWINFAANSPTRIDAPRGNPRINRIAQEMLANPHLVITLTGYHAGSDTTMAATRAQEVKTLIGAQLLAAGITGDVIAERITLNAASGTATPPGMDGNGEGVHISIVDTQLIT